MNLIRPEMVFDQKITLCSSVSVSLTLIGKENCGMIGAIAVSSSGWEKTKFGFQVERACERRSVFFCLPNSSPHILKITPLVKKPWEQGSVNAFYILSTVQFWDRSVWPESDKPKTPKFISKSLITPLV